MDGWRLIVQIMDNLKDIQNMTSKLLFFRFRDNRG